MDSHPAVFFSFMSLNEDVSVFSPPSGQEGGEVKMTGPSVPGFYGSWLSTLLALGHMPYIAVT